MRFYEDSNPGIEPEGDATGTEGQDETDNAPSVD